MSVGSWRAIRAQLVWVCLGALAGACGSALEEEPRGALVSQRGAEAAPTLGRIIVSHDEWTLSNSGFSQNGNTAAFARNIAAWFTGGRPGHFLVYSTNFGLRESTLASVMSQAGHTWTASTSVPFTLGTLLQYDAVFLAGDPANTSVLTQYVQAGGSVYLAAGTGLGDAVSEAARWNPFLQAFGLSYAPAYNGLCANFGGTTAHPVTSGVPSLYSCNGNSVSRLNPADSHTAIIQSASGQGLLGIYDGCPNAADCKANQAPVALCRDVVVVAGDACIAAASIDNGSYDPDYQGSPLQFTQSPAGPYGLGTTTVTLTVSDGGASSQCQGHVTVVDATPPTIQCPANLQLACSQGGAVSFAPTAHDNCGTASIACSPESGSAFPSGETHVTCVARDGAGIPAVCQFSVTVEDSAKVHLSDSNLFLLEDYSQGHDVQGKVAAGGNITLTDFAVGAGLAPSELANTLVAGGNLSLSRGGVWGDAWYGGSLTSDPSVVFPRGAVSHGAPIDFAARFAELRHLSTQLASRAANGSTTRENWGGLMLHGAALDVNVFDVEASAFTGAKLLFIDAPAGSLAVVNIRGASATFTGFGIQFSGGIDQHGVLYNFVDATSLSAHGFGFWGTVLAPYAHIDFTEGSFDGGIYALSLTGNAEGHINPLTERELCQ